MLQRIEILQIKTNNYQDISNRANQVHQEEHADEMVQVMETKIIICSTSPVAKSGVTNSTHNHQRTGKTWPVLKNRLNQVIA
jgi:hypothetical protein